MVPHWLKTVLHLHMDSIALSSHLSGLPTPISAHFLLQCPLALNHLCPQSYSHSDVLCPVQWPPGCSPHLCQQSAPLRSNQPPQRSISVALQSSSTFRRPRMQRSSARPQVPMFAHTGVGAHVGPLLENALPRPWRSATSSSRSVGIIRRRRKQCGDPPGSSSFTGTL